MYKILIFILLTFFFSFFAKAQAVEKHLDSDDVKTTIIEKVPDSDNIAILNNLDMGSFSLTDQVYIKDYEHEPMEAEVLPQKQEKLLTAIPTKVPAIRVKSTVKTASLANKIDAIEYEEVQEMTASTSGPSVPNIKMRRKVVQESPSPKITYVVSAPVSTRKKVKRAVVAPKAEKVVVNNSRTVAMQEARAAAEYRKNKKDRNPVGEKTKSRRGKRVPNWNSDKRGSGGILKCFKFK